jgi:hypothetical protein
MADVVLTITIPDAKVTTATTGFLKLYPNTELVDPSAETPVLKYTTKDWVEEKVRRNIVRDVRRGLQMAENEASIIAEDDGIAVIS